MTEQGDTLTRLQHCCSIFCNHMHVLTFFRRVCMRVLLFRVRYPFNTAPMVPLLLPPAFHLLILRLTPPRLKKTAKLTKKIINNHIGTSLSTFDFYLRGFNTFDTELSSLKENIFSRSLSKFKQYIRTEKTL